METELARKVAEAIQAEFSLLEFQVVVSDENFDIGALPELHLCLKVLGFDQGWELDNPVVLADILSPDASVSLELPIQEGESESFIGEVIKRINILLEEIPVIASILDIERVVSDLTGLDTPDEIDAFEVEPQFTIGRLEDQIGEYMSLQKVLSTEALERIKGAIKWPVIEDDTDTHTSGIH